MEETVDMIKCYLTALNLLLLGICFKTFLFYVLLSTNLLVNLTSFCFQICPQLIYRQIFLYL